jgi:hypothetical protein
MLRITLPYVAQYDRMFLEPSPGTKRRLRAERTRGERLIKWPDRPGRGEHAAWILLANYYVLDSGVCLELVLLLYNYGNHRSAILLYRNSQIAQGVLLPS